MELPTRFSPTFLAAIDGHLGHLLCHPFEQMSENRWHQVSAVGDWDTDGLRKDYLAQMFHSKSSADAGPSGDFDETIETFSFKLADNVFVSFEMRLPNHGKIDVWAVTPELAQQHFLALRSKYGRAPKPRRQKEATLLMLKLCDGFVETERVFGLKNFLAGKADLALHYGGEFASWAPHYLRTLRSQHSGLSIFRGPPGTGKTSFLRYLIHKLKHSHSFYYLPVSHYGMLSDPAMSEFWIKENLRRTGIKKVIILEDAEPLLLERGGDNWRHLSNLLNVSDGLLGEFLRVHILCTMNAEATQIDRAVLRSGRLIASRQFERLRAQDARKLAAAKGLQLSQQKDYSLAEIYHGNSVNGSDIAPTRHVGF
jgi:ATPase family associated with various cellular activities (AAA)